RARVDLLLTPVERDHVTAEPQHTGEQDPGPRPARRETLAADEQHQQQHQRPGQQPPQGQRSRVVVLARAADRHEGGRPQQHSDRGGGERLVALSQNGHQASLPFPRVPAPPILSRGTDTFAASGRLVAEDPYSLLSACSKSATRSSAPSIPQDNRTRSSGMPTRARWSAPTLACEVTAGLVIVVSTPPRLGAT